jgi:hypothetical protein
MTGVALYVVAIARGITTAGRITADSESEPALSS